MKISGVMITYNGEKYINTQLESILYQTKQLDELIICDDCSSDMTAKIIYNFIEKNNLSNWKLIINKFNLGPFENIKKALNFIKGDIIFLIDQDNIWKNNLVEIAFSEMLDNNDIELLYFENLRIDQNDCIIGKQNLHNRHSNEIFNVELIQLVYYFGYTGASMCFSRILYMKLKKYLEYTPMHRGLYIDVMLPILAAISNGLFVYNKNYLVLYRIFPESYSNKGKYSVGIYTKQEMLMEIGIGIEYLNIFRDILNKFNYVDYKINKTINKRMLIYKIMKRFLECPNWKNFCVLLMNCYLCKNFKELFKVIFCGIGIGKVIKFIRIYI